MYIYSSVAKLSIRCCMVNITAHLFIKTDVQILTILLTLDKYGSLAILAHA